MKEATGELSGTVITVVAIAAVATIFTLIVLPNIKKTITCKSVDDSCFAGCAQKNCPCQYYEGDSTQPKDIMCPNPYYNN